MVRSHIRRPSAALIVSMLALVVALGGTALAGPVAQLAKQISGSSIRAHTITGSRLKNNTLTGTQIRESTLGTVPSALAAATATVAGTANKANSATSATHASTADLASNANALGGVPATAFAAAALTQRFSATMAKGDANKTLGTFGPVTYTASCALGTGPDAGKTVAVITGTANADGVFVQGTLLNNTQSVQVLKEANTAPDDATATILVVTDSAASSPLEGNAVAIVNTAGKDCRFFGHLTNDG